MASYLSPRFDVYSLNGFWEWRLNGRTQKQGPILVYYNLWLYTTRATNETINMTKNTILNFQKQCKPNQNGLEIWRIYISTNLALIRMLISTKMDFTDVWRTTTEWQWLRCAVAQRRGNKKREGFPREFSTYLPPPPNKHRHKNNLTQTEVWIMD